MAERKYYGIKFPITVESDEKHLFDLNDTKGKDVTSQLMHLIFTPKGQMLRNPNFGTQLIQFMFNPNDQQTWDDIVEDIRNAVSTYVLNCRLKNIETKLTDDGNGILVKIVYEVKESDGRLVEYTTTTKI